MKKILLSLAGLFLLTSLYAQKSKIAVEQPVVVASDTVYGTLVTQFPPDSRKIKKQPLVIIIPGSGPTDRDGNSMMLPGPNNAFKQLADSLLQEEVASFRYDKPGVGASETTKKEEEMRFYDNVEVVKKVYGKMRDIGFKDIYLLGHSEGSLIGMLAAQELKTKGFISIGGTGRGFYKILREQLENNLPKELQASTLRKIDSIRDGHKVTQYSPMLSSLLRESVQPYLRSTFQYDPGQEIGEIKQPVLIVHGGNDTQVTEEDAEILKAAKPEAEYLHYPDMNHVLKITDGSEQQNHGSYSDPDFPLNPELASDIASWIESH